MAGWGVEVSFSSSIKLFTKTWVRDESVAWFGNQLGFVYSKYIPKLKAPRKSKHPPSKVFSRFLCCFFNLDLYKQFSRFPPPCWSQAFYR